MSIIFNKHWRLNCLGLILSSLFLFLSFWQYQRAQEKERLLTTFHKRESANHLTNKEIITSIDKRFYHATLTGTFDNAHTILLDNRTFKGKIGYEIYTPFRLRHSAFAILVDRGFVALSGSSRDTVPTLSFPTKTTITGLINTAPHYYSKGKMINDTRMHPLIRIEYIDQKALSQLLRYPLLPEVLQLAQTDEAAYPIIWQTTIMPKEKHIAYSLQWFALSLTLLVLLVVLNKRNTQ